MLHACLTKTNKRKTQLELDIGEQVRTAERKRIATTWRGRLVSALTVGRPRDTSMIVWCFKFIDAFSIRIFWSRTRLKRCLIRITGVVAVMFWWIISKHPAYVGVHKERQLQVILDQAFIEAAIAPESGVGLDKDSSSSTTISVKEYRQHDRKECQRIHYYHPLRVIDVHVNYSIERSPLLTNIYDPPTTHSLSLRTLRGLLL
jgi:hypothetical protein